FRVIRLSDAEYELIAGVRIVAIEHHVQSEGAGHLLEHGLGELSQVEILAPGKSLQFMRGEGFPGFAKIGPGNWLLEVRLFGNVIGWVVRGSRGSHLRLQRSPRADGLAPQPISIVLWRQGSGPGIE